MFERPKHTQSDYNSQLYVDISTRDTESKN